MGVEEAVVVLKSGEALVEEWERGGEKMLLGMANKCRLREGRVLLSRRVFERLNISYLFLWSELIDVGAWIRRAASPKVLVLGSRI